MKKTKETTSTTGTVDEKKGKDTGMDLLTGSKLIENSAKQLARKYTTISKDTWKKEAIDLYEHNDKYDGEAVSLSWFMSKLESIVAEKYGEKVSKHQVRSENDDDFEEYKILKSKGML